MLIKINHSDDIDFVCRDPDAATKLDFNGKLYCGAMAFMLRALRCSCLPSGLLRTHSFRDESAGDGDNGDDVDSANPVHTWPLASAMHRGDHLAVLTYMVALQPQVAVFAASSLHTHSPRALAAHHCTREAQLPEAVCEKLMPGFEAAANDFAASLSSVYL